MANQESSGNAEFERYVSVVHKGNRTLAAEALGCTRIHVWRMIRGDRAVTPDMAEKIHTATRGRFKRERLVWPGNKGR
jgi:plasmid maintenance system antidote protein VapI